MIRMGRLCSCKNLRRAICFMTRDNWTAFSGRPSDKLDIFTAAMRILILPCSSTCICTCSWLWLYSDGFFSHSAHLRRSHKLEIESEWWLSSMTVHYVHLHAIYESILFFLNKMDGRFGRISTCSQQILYTSTIIHYFIVESYRDNTLWRRKFKRVKQKHEKYKDMRIRNCIRNVRTLLWTRTSDLPRISISVQLSRKDMTGRNNSWEST